MDMAVVVAVVVEAAICHVSRREVVTGTDRVLLAACVVALSPPAFCAC